MRDSMVDTIIVSGGNIQKGFALDFLRESLKGGGGRRPCLIAADKGLEFLVETQIFPDSVIGDFDSLSAEGKEYLKQARDLEIRRLRPEKDDSDTQSAVCLAVEKGAREILLLGATGSRLDHMLANIGLLAMGKERGVHISIADANNYMMLAEDGMVLEKEQQFGKYVSFFPLGEEVTGLTLEGFKYPLHGHHLKASDSGLTVSNEIIARKAKVTFDKGTLLMVMSRD